MKKLIYALTIFALGIFAVRVGETASSLKQLEDGVLRLHILADSDSTQDQFNKLLVRDALLKRSAEWSLSASDRTEMETTLTENLPLIEEIAEETLRAAGCTDAVTATLCAMEFPARTYGDVTLPAGEYQALRLTIGSGDGQNWWCVMYPSLCVPAASEETEPSETLETYFDDTVCEMTTDPESYEVRLKCVELIRAISDWVTDKLEALTISDESGE